MYIEDVSSSYPADTDSSLVIESPDDSGTLNGGSLSRLDALHEQSYTYMSLHIVNL